MNEPLDPDPQLFLRVGINEARALVQIALREAMRSNAYETTLRHLAVAAIALEDAYEQRGARHDHEFAARQRLADGVPF